MARELNIRGTPVPVPILDELAADAERAQHVARDLRDTVTTGHGSATVAPESRMNGGHQGRALDRASAVPGWPRLLGIEAAAVYVGISAGMLREYIVDGTLRVTRPVRPNTNRAHGIRAGKRTRRTAASEHVRRLLIDRADLDALVDAWKRGA